MNRQNYSEIRAELAVANEWLASLGIREQQDRIRQHIRRIGQLEEAWRAGTLFDATRGEDGRLAMFSLTEAMEFLTVHRAFGQEHPAELPDRIKDALDGPADVHDESAKSNRGRNLMFELGLASRLRSKGLSVDLPVNPDIIARTEMAPIYIQCKRPFRQETIANNIHVAEKQLTRDLDQATNPQAEASSQYLYRGSSMLAASSCTRGARYHGGLGKEVQRLGETYREAWSAISNPRIIAILFHLITPAFVEDLALLTTAQQIVGLHLPGRSQADTALLRNLEEILA